LAFLQSALHSRRNRTHLYILSRTQKEILAIAEVTCVMPQIDLTARELTILEFVLMDLREAIDDGDRPEFRAGEVNMLMQKVLSAQKALTAQTLEEG